MIILKRNKMKRILVLKACGNSGEPHECNGICEQAELYQMEHVCKNVRTNRGLKRILSHNDQFDYIYLSAHGNSEGFCSEDGKVDMTWEEMAEILCESGCMKDECILMLSCCRGGLLDVAYKMFFNCQKICYVLGPRQNLASVDMQICFGIFLYNMEVRSVDPVVACDKIRLATDQRFSCYDRQEESMNMDIYREMHYIDDTNSNPSV